MTDPNNPDPNNPAEYWETKIVMRPGEPPVKARARIEWVRYPPTPGAPSVPSR